MKISHASLLTIFALAIFTGAGCSSGERGTGIAPSVTVIPNPAPQPTLSENILTDNAAGYSFIYDKLFTASEPNAGAHLLTSPYSVTDNPSGVPGNEHTHRLETEIRRIQGTGLEDAMKKDNPSFAETYESFAKKETIPAGLLDIITVGGKESYRFSVGAEGLNTKFVYVPVSDKETIVIKFSSIGDILEKSVKPRALPETQQLAYLERILNTFTFAK